MTTRKRSRNMSKDKPEADAQPKAEITRGSENVLEDLGLDEEEVAEATAEAVAIVEAQARIPLPTTVDGCGVLDAVGNRLCICGYDSNRATSGPALARAVSEAINRVHGK